MIAHPLLVRRPTAPKPAPPLPADPELPQLREVLDGQRVADWLRPVLHRDHLEARPRYIRYKPGNKATILYDIGLDGLWTFAILTAASRRDLRKVLDQPDTLDLIRLARGRTPAPEPVMCLDEPKALVEWYPLNRALPGLLVEPAQLASSLPVGSPESGESEDPELLVYKPERRAVLQWGHRILKVYARGDDLAQAVEGLAISSGIPGLLAPNLVTQIAAARLTMQGMIRGYPLPNDRISRSHLGEAMARVHGAGIMPTRILSPQDHLKMAGVTSRHVAFLLPDIAARLERLLLTLESHLPPARSVVPSHGDFNEDQALATNHGVALLDFDHVCLADPAFDPATLAAYRLQGCDGDLESAMQALEEVLSGYGRVPENLGWYLAVAAIRRLPFPFRFLATDWPDRVRQIVLSTSELVQVRSP